ncbi:hypothetical protein A5886_000474 [Enterococcus sp. 8G7_MSG3316]|uniref:DUF1680 domain-containing protein n=1 Tax=Candidatus Enterococcus testudinis TaxID=1834191 RepID=A0A242A305_9ENTE|nr:beta-L-arabinofuranosidase domain-containing protein [Enterococcus sp. 8G7_MSG3316]OTN75404.1 hypothetical protein A5886_000474 [Enterococcus sp. 8G7_MSG3316]
MKEFDLHAVSLKDPFWQHYQKIVREETIPYQYQVLNDALDVDVQAEREDASLPAGKSHALENFRIAAKQKEGNHFGWFFQDSDVYKWIESAAYSLINQKDPSLVVIVDEVVALLGAAQEEDGYLNTFFQLTRPELKYRQLYFSHELYCAGHLVEAAIAYDLATGKKELLDIAEKNVQNIMHYFGREANQIQGADGHQEIELALVRLFEHTNNEKYVALADFFLAVRGENPDFYTQEIAENRALGLSTEEPSIDLTYLQAYDQPKNQREAKGHAVRMLYMASGMAKVAQHTKDPALIEACVAIWQDIAYKKMYVTGGVGGTVHGEAFIGAFDLPNDTMYCETCASIALVQFSFEMFKLTQQHQYLDTLTRALYNSVLSGASIDGKQFFYVNPLEVMPDSCHHNPGKGHVKTQRPDWLGCACCPPNFARLISALQRFVYTQENDTLYINLFAASRLVQADQFVIEQIGNFPFENQMTIRYTGVAQKIVIYKPKWLQSFQIECEQAWQETDETLVFAANTLIHAKIIFQQPIQMLRANPLINQDINQVAVQRGPFVYCLEEADNGKGISQCRLPIDTVAFRLSESQKLWSPTLVINFDGFESQKWTQEALYLPMNEPYVPKNWQLIPYHLWGNRGEGEMRVWLPLALVK